MIEKIQSWKSAFIETFLIWGAVMSFLIFIVNKVGMSIGDYIVFALAIVNPVGAFLVKVIAYMVSVTFLFYLYKILTTIFASYAAIKMLTDLIKEKLGK